MQEYWTQVDRCWNAYDAIIEVRSEAASWTHKEAPPIIQHIVETMLAGMLDEYLKFKVRPRPRMFEQGELELALKGAKSHEILLNFQLDADRFDEKKRAFVLQERVAGMSPMKVYWRKSTRMRKRLSEQKIDVGGAVFPQLVETEEPEVMYDGPCVEVIDVRDFVFDLSSVSPERCGFYAHRIWMTEAELKAYERSGLYKNVGSLQESSDATRDATTKKNKDRIEVWEIWQRQADGKIKVFTVGDRNVLLSERENPFWHGEMPFVVFSAQSKPFRMIGKSQVQKLMALQTMVWTLLNQTLDNTLLANNAIVLMREDMDDPEAFRFEPGAINTVSVPGEVVMWTPDTTATQVAMPMLGKLEQWIQNLAGGQPFTSTSEARTAQANTATEASLVANIAQRNVITAKTQLNYAYRRMCQQMIELNQQFVRDAVYVGIVDLDTPEEQAKITPVMLQGDFFFEPDPMDESLMRQERRAESMALFNALAQGAQLNAMLAAQGFMRPIDWERVFTDLLETHEKDAALYFKDMPAPQAPPMGGAPGQPQQQPQQGPGGVTNPMAAAGQLAPSNENSMSGMAAMQQYMAASQGGSRQ